MPDRHIQRLLQLVVGLANLDFAVEAVNLDAFQSRCHLHGVGRLGLGHGSAQRLENADGGAGVEVVVVFGLEFVLPFLHLATHVVVVVCDLVDTTGAIGSQCSRCAGDAGVVGEELAVVAILIGGLDQQRQVRAPVAGNHGVGAGGLDLGDVGGEVTSLGQWMKVFANDLDVGALAGQRFLGVLGYLHTVRIVLSKNIDLLDVFLRLHEARHRFHLHGGVSIETEVPVAALGIGQIRVHRRVIQVDHFLARIAFVVFGDSVGQSQRNRRTVALDDVAHALVDSRFQRVQAFGGAQLVVDTGHFKLDTCGVAGATELLGKELVALELAHTHRTQQPGLGINTHHLDRLALLGHDRSRTHCCRTECNQFQRKFHLLSPVNQNTRQGSFFCALQRKGFPLEPISKATGAWATSAPKHQAEGSL